MQPNHVVLTTRNIHPSISALNLAINAFFLHCMNRSTIFRVCESCDNVSACVRIRMRVRARVCEWACAREDIIAAEVR